MHLNTVYRIVDGSELFTVHLGIEDIQKYNELQVNKFVSALHRCNEEGARCTSLTKHGRGKGGGREAGPQRPKAR
jgi:hypothetical protein